MKRILFILLATLSTAVCSAGTNAMSNSKVRKETRFLTDKNGLRAEPEHRTIQ